MNEAGTEKDPSGKSVAEGEEALARLPTGGAHRDRATEQTDRNDGQDRQALYRQK